MTRTKGGLISATTVAMLIALSGACTSGGPASSPAAAPDKPVVAAEQEKRDASPPATRPQARRVDPRKGGLEIGLGEWALAPEAEAIRPGKVTFVVHNRGTMAHGFEIELEGDSSGHGSGDLFKAETETLQPGESTRMTVSLPPGLYKIECLVDGHDDMGMEGILDVRANAPLVKVERAAAPNEIAIEDFEFSPQRVVVAPGTEVTWHNDDPAEHTVTGTDGDFGSDSLGAGDSFAHLFEQPGLYRYRCAIHPEMEGEVRVE